MHVDWHLQLLYYHALRWTTMPQGSIHSSADAVGVAVVNYKVPVCETHEVSQQSMQCTRLSAQWLTHTRCCVPVQDVIANCHRIAKTMDGAKLGYPGLDLVGGGQEQFESVGPSSC